MKPSLQLINLHIDATLRNKHRKPHARTSEHTKTTRANRTNHKKTAHRQQQQYVLKKASLHGR